MTLVNLFLKGYPPLMWEQCIDMFPHDVFHFLIDTGDPMVQKKGGYHTLDCPVKGLPKSDLKIVHQWPFLKGNTNHTDLNPIGWGSFLKGNQKRFLGDETRWNEEGMHDGCLTPLENDLRQETVKNPKWKSISTSVLYSTFHLDGVCLHPNLEQSLTDASQYKHTSCLSQN
jgi:hypothetical protein